MSGMAPVRAVLTFLVLHTRIVILHTSTSGNLPNFELSKKAYNYGN